MNTCAVYTRALTRNYGENMRSYCWRKRSSVQFAKRLQHRYTVIRRGRNASVRLLALHKTQLHFLSASIYRDKLATNSFAIRYEQPQCRKYPSARLLYQKQSNLLKMNNQFCASATLKLNEDICFSLQKSTRHELHFRNQRWNVTLRDV